MTKPMLVALGLMLAGCGPLVQIGGNGKPPATLLTLRAEPGDTVAATRNPILVTLPSVPGALRTLRIPVTTEATQLAYLPGASWVEQPNVLFQRLMAEVIQARTGRPAVNERAVDVASVHRLSGQLLEFGLDVRGGSAVRVRYDAVLTRPDTGFVGGRRFEATAAVASESGADVARALNAAANGIARDVADWVAENA